MPKEFPKHTLAAGKMMNAGGSQDPDDWLVAPDGQPLAQSVYDQKQGAWSLKIKGDKGWTTVEKVTSKMGSYGLMRIAFPILPEAAMAYQWPLFILGTISVLYGAFLCLAQDDLKSLIAYSSVSHMGMITIALATFNELGWAGAAYMNLAHGIISAGMFMRLRPSSVARTGWAATPR